ncbi:MULTISPECIES: hypothetical protein [Paenibacillus]|uniref:hypothetical protein n=1 Tax=Paenibacillus TaxID=44249 RepID=UPI0021162858|nr:hypothetical protein [Paenibacillus borealis]
MNSAALFFDDYDFPWPDEFERWMERGADYNEWKLEPLVADLKGLLARADRPEYILLDYPFAYVHNELSRFIDYAIFIDTPLDVAMARRFIRDDKDSASSDVTREMEGYLRGGREAYLAMLHTVLPSSDYVADGTLPVNDLTDLLLEQIKHKGSEDNEASKTASR